MSNFSIKIIHTDNLEDELKNIGFDSGYIDAAVSKYRYKNIKIYNVTSAQANIIKQTAISVGADCATNRNVITGTAEKTDAILGGSIDELKKISEKLKKQPFNLASLGEEIVKVLYQTKSKTKLVGILNITPDSFSDGGEFLNPEAAKKHLTEMIEDGADIIDIGAESTRPFSSGENAETQIKRLEPILNFVQKENLKIPISIDTRSSEVADFCLNNGADIINDVSGFDFDKKMPEIIAKYKARVIIQHSKGTPENMQEAPAYENLIDEIFKNLQDKIKLAESFGINDIIVDPGIGFGKTANDNFEIIKRAGEFRSLNYPIMLGLSRKSFLGIKDNDNSLKDALTLALSYPLINMGIDYLRVHNVKLHKYIIDMGN